MNSVLRKQPRNILKKSGRSRGLKTVRHVIIRETGWSQSMVRKVIFQDTSLVYFSSSESTIRQTLTHVKAFFEFLVQNGGAIDNPVTHIKAPVEVRKAPKWLTRNEQNALIRAVRKGGNLRDFTLITMLLHTGLRVQEVCNVHLSDIDLGERRGTVNVLGKHNRYREVPLNADVRKVLAQYIPQRKHNGEYLFTNRQGEQMTTRAAQLVIEEYRKHTEIKHLTAHALRHTFCHELVTRKVPLDVVARLAGHVKNDGTPNIQQTLVYTQPGEEDLQRAVEELSWR